MKNIDNSDISAWWNPLKYVKDETRETFHLHIVSLAYLSTKALINTSQI